MTRVLIVDDSPLAREILARELTRDPEIVIAGFAPDAYVAWAKIVELKPDVVTLDLEMPRMNGIPFLRKLLRFHRVPVVVVSSLTPAGSALALEALDAGAVEVVAKPRLGGSIQRLVQAVKGAAQARVVATDGGTARRRLPAGRPPASRIVAIGASTGGTQALQQILASLPKTAPAIAVVQHMPEGFTASFAERLDRLCAVEVKEAEDTDVLEPGRVLIAPGDRHLLLRRSGERYRVEVKGGPPVSGHRPSVDLLFKSFARQAGADGLGLLLTGMGKDGARGLLEMRRAGARTVAQDEASSVVFGMPREAIELGAAARVEPLDRMAGLICGA